MRDLGRLIIWYPFRWIVVLFPMPMVIGIGRMMGKIESLYSKKRMTIIAQNIHRTLGIELKDAYDIVRRNLELHYIHLLEYFKFPYFSRNNIDRYIEYCGLEYLNDGLRQGKGIILIHLHFGTMQMPLIALGVKGYRMNQIGQKEPENNRLSWVHRKVALRQRLKIEESMPVNFINIGITNFLRPAFRCLEKNEILLIPGDGRGGTKPVGENYILINFLNHKIYFPRGPVILARKTRAKMLPLFCFRLPDGRQRVEIRPPLPLCFSQDKEADVLNNTQIYADALSEEVRKHPDHWMFWQEFAPGLMIYKE